jgi:hypothetical protein
MKYIKLTILINFIFSASVISQSICFKTIDDYSYPQNYNSGFVNLFHSTVGDFNNDGFKDIVLGGSGSLLLYYNGTSTGTYSPSSSLTNINFTINVHGLLSGDYNNDGKLDLAVMGNINSGQTTKIQILYGNGNGTFIYGNTYVSPQSTQYNFVRSFKQGDFNNDGFIDFVLGFDSNVNLPNLWTVMNSQSGNLTFNNPAPTYSGTAYADVIDFNNDNKLDIISNNASGLQGNGNGTFASNFINLAGINFGTITEVEDLDNDGFKDILYYGSTINNIYYRYNNGSGGFSNEYSVISEYPLSSMKIADMNGDGLKDIVAYVDSLSVLQIFKNNGFNVFTPAAKIEVVAPTNISTYTQYNYSIADLNNDSKMDIVMPGGTNSKFSAILGNTTLSYNKNDVVKFHGVNFSIGVTANDFNNDGIGDFTSPTSNMNIGLGLAGGGFTNTTSGPFSGAGGKLYSMDFNNDGFKDVICLNNNAGPSNTFFTYQGNGNGNFTNLYSVTNNPSWITTANDVAFADFDNDNYLDIVTANVSLFGYSILKGNANFSFPTFTFATLTSASNDVVTGDFNNDGFPDFVTVNGGAQINTLLGNGNCTFQAPLNMPLPSSCALIAAGNFNGDNFKDLVVLNTSSGGNNLHVLFGNGSGNFTINQSIPLNTTFSDIKSADLNNDGKDEIILTKFGALNNLWVGSANSSNFLSFTKFTVSNAPYQVDVYDMNNDGAKDIIVADQFSANSTGVMKILYNTTAISNNLSSTYTVCPGGAVLVSIPNNYNIQWSNGGSLNPKLFNSPGVYTVTSSNLSGSCVSSKTLQIVTNSAAITPLNITNTNTILCNSNSPFILTANPSPSSFYGNNIYQNMYYPQQALTGINKVYASYTNTNQCTSIDSIAFTINQAPVVNAGNDTTVCNTSVINLNGTGNATSYSWNNAVLNNIPFAIGNIPLNGTTYVATGINSFGCVSKDSLTVNLDNTCNIVWPGDTDVNGIVNSNDFLVLGLGYGFNGLPRAIMGNSWNPYQSSYWNGLIPSTNYTLCYSDCNGNGIINLGDTLAINLNFSLTHLVKPVNEEHTSNLNADLYFQFNKTIYNSGDTVIADIFLGKPISIITNLYGTSYYLQYDDSNFKSGGVKVSYDNSTWIGLNNLSKINFSKVDQPNGRIDFAIVKTTHTDTSGYGKVCSLRMILKDTVLVSNAVFSLKNAIKMNKVGIKTPISSATDSIYINPLDVGLRETPIDFFISISPNPTNGHVNINSKDLISEIEIINLVGQTLYKKKIDEKLFYIDLRNYNNGVYIIKSTNINKTIRFDKIILDKK